MGNILNEDFSDFLKALELAGVQYMLVGGYAVIFHGYNRTTGNLDIWVNPNTDNYEKLKKAFGIFGMSLFDMIPEKFLDSENYDVFTFGRPPVCIEILTRVKGLDFKNAYNNSTIRNFDGNEVRIIDVRDLIAAKKAANRPKDLDDLEHITIE